MFARLFGGFSIVTVLGALMLLPVGTHQAAAFTPTAVGVPPSTSDASAARDMASARATAKFISDLNRLRVERGEHPLITDTTLGGVAAMWTGSMAARGVLSHNPSLADQLGAGWTKGGENVGSGPNETSLEAAFVNSPGHLANILDPAFDAVGVQVAITASGTMFVTEDFAALPPSRLVASGPPPVISHESTPPPSALMRNVEAIAPIEHGLRSSMTLGSLALMALGLCVLGVREVALRRRPLGRPESLAAITG